MPSLVQIMVCCRAGAEPLSEPMLEYSKLDPWGKLEWNLNHNSNISIQGNASGNVVRKFAAILSRPQCVIILCTMRIAKGSTLNDIPADTWRIDNIIINYVKTTLQRCIDITMKLLLPYVMCPLGCHNKSWQMTSWWQYNWSGWTLPDYCRGRQSLIRKMTTKDFWFIWFPEL